MTKNKDLSKMQSHLPGFKGKKTASVVVGTESYVNQRTGQVEDFTVVTKTIDSDTNFHKVWLGDLLSILHSFGSKKIKIFSFLLRNMRNEDNTVSVTHEAIAKACGVSRPTVSLTIKELQDNGMLKKLMPATYQFNPDIIARGSAKKRQRLLVEYNYPEDSEENADLELLD